MDRFHPLAHPTIEDWTTFLSLTMFFSIFIVLFGVLLVILLAPVHTYMQRGWRSLMTAFNLVMFRAVYLFVVQEDALPQPYQLIFLLVVTGFIAHFAVAFHYTWVAPLFGAIGRWRFVLPLVILTAGVVGASLAFTFYR